MYPGSIPGEASNKFHNKNNGLLIIWLRTSGAFVALVSQQIPLFFNVSFFVPACPCDINCDIDEQNRRP